MRKAIRMILLAVGLVWTVAACVNGNEEASPEPTVKTTLPAEPSTDEKAALLSEGKVQEIEFGIGADAAEVIASRGEPSLMDYMEGGLYLKYDDVVFFTDATADSGEDGTPVGRVIALGFPAGTTVFGLEVGSASQADFIERFGPEHGKRAPNSGTGTNLLYGEDWAVEFVYGDYVLAATSELEDGITNGAYLVRRSE